MSASNPSKDTLDRIRTNEYFATKKEILRIKERLRFAISPEEKEVLLIKLDVLKFEIKKYELTKPLTE